MPGGDDSVAILAVELRGHMDADRASFNRINQDTSEIKATLASLTTKVESAFERIHTRIDETATSARHALSNESAVSRAGVKAAMEFAQEAHNRIGEENTKLTDRITGLKIWILTGGGGLLIATLAWFADHFFGSGGR